MTQEKIEGLFGGLTMEQQHFIGWREARNDGLL